MKNKNYLGRNLKKIMLEKNLTQKEVADKIGIEQTVISRWARGAAVPTIASIKKLSSVFGVPLNYFLENYEDEEDRYKKLLQLEEENSRMIKEILQEIREIKKQK
ncbi:MAG: helix-turn-helix transcriptional regulator [Elusimicrobia bacterium]|nr:helix-turn-helix transcriptional regulator [Elusimicrobiota bacterium]